MPFYFSLWRGSRAFTRSPQRPVAAPAGLRWLLKSPPRHAGQAQAAWRATAFNPCRIPTRFCPTFSTCLVVLNRFIFTFENNNLFPSSIIQII